MLSYVLNKEISGDIILRDIQQLVQKQLNTQSGNDMVLVIDIKSISRTIDDHIPKIEYKSTWPFKRVVYYMIESFCFT